MEPLSGRLALAREQTVETGPSPILGGRGARDNVWVGIRSLFCLVSAGVWSGVYEMSPCSIILRIEGLLEAAQSTMQRALPFLQIW